MKEKNVKVIICSPMENNVTIVVKEIKNHFETFQELVGGSFQMPFISEKLAHEGISVYINDEGKLINLEPSMLITKDDKLLDYFVGTCVFVSHDDDGNTISLNEKQINYLKKNVFNKIGFIKFESDENEYVLPCIEF